MAANNGSATQFGKGRNIPGRPKGVKDRISTAFLRAIAEEFEKHGVWALAKVRKNDPSTFIKVVASLMPKEIEIKTPESALTDDQVEALYSEMLQARLARLEAEDPPKTVN